MSLCLIISNKSSPCTHVLIISLIYAELQAVLRQAQMCVINVSKL